MFLGQYVIIKGYNQEVYVDFLVITAYRVGIIGHPLQYLHNPCSIEGLKKKKWKDLQNIFALFNTKASI